MSSTTEQAAAILAEHRVWAMTGPGDDGTWTLTCFECGASLGDVEKIAQGCDEEGRGDAFDRAHATHQADVLAPVLAGTSEREQR